MKKTRWIILKTVVVIALLIAAGFGIYKMGYSQGVLSNISIEELTTVHENFIASSPMGNLSTRGYAHPSFGYGMPGHFGIARFLGGILLLFIIGGIFRSMRMHRYMRMAHMMNHMGKDFDGYRSWHHGPFCGRFWEKDSPEQDTSSEEKSSEEAVTE